jgi:hypothetical protein
VQYKEGELLSDHLKSGDGTLLEVKIPAECTVSTNLQVRARHSSHARSLRLSQSQQILLEFLPPTTSTPSRLSALPF